jgi:hypothetical protein
LLLLGALALLRRVALRLLLEPAPLLLRALEPLRRLQLLALQVPLPPLRLVALGRLHAR